MKIKFMGVLRDDMLFFKADEYCYIFVDISQKEVWVRDNWAVMCSSVELTSLGGHDDREEEALDIIKNSDVIEQMKKVKERLTPERKKRLEEFIDWQNETLESHNIEIE